MSGSLLPPDLVSELSQLLDALQSADNSVRTQAEAHLETNWTTPKPEVLLMGLVEQIQGSNDPTVGNTPIQEIYHYLTRSSLNRRVHMLL